MHVRRLPLRPAHVLHRAVRPLPVATLTVVDEGRTMRVVEERYAAPVGGVLMVPMARDEFRELDEADVLGTAEWYDGLCVVSAPTIRHQIAVMQLLRLLDRTASADDVLVPSVGWDTELGELVPDVVVFAREHLTRHHLLAAPKLGVEVASPSTGHLDRGRKRELYAASGMAWYWLVDLDRGSMTVLELVDGDYVERQHLTVPGTTVGPYAVDVDPAALGEA